MPIRGVSATLRVAALAWVILIIPTTIWAQQTRQDELRKFYWNEDLTALPGRLMVESAGGDLATLQIALKRQFGRRYANPRHNEALEVEITPLPGLLPKLMLVTFTRARPAPGVIAPLQQQADDSGYPVYYAGAELQRSSFQCLLRPLDAVDVGWPLYEIKAGVLLPRQADYYRELAEKRQLPFQIDGWQLRYEQNAAAPKVSARLAPGLVVYEFKEMQAAAQSTPQRLLAAAPNNLASSIQTELALAGLIDFMEERFPQLQRFDLQMQRRIQDTVQQAGDEFMRSSFGQGVADYFTNRYGGGQLATGLSRDGLNFIAGGVISWSAAQLITLASVATPTILGVSTIVMAKGVVISVAVVTVGGLVYYVWSAPTAYDSGARLARGGMTMLMSGLGGKFATPWIGGAFKPLVDARLPLSWRRAAELPTQVAWLRPLVRDTRWMSPSAQRLHRWMQNSGPISPLTRYRAPWVPRRFDARSVAGSPDTNPAVRLDVPTAGRLAVLEAATAPKNALRGADAVVRKMQTAASAGEPPPYWPIIMYGERADTVSRYPYWKPPGDDHELEYHESAKQFADEYDEVQRDRMRRDRQEFDALPDDFKSSFLNVEEWIAAGRPEAPLTAQQRKELFLTLNTELTVWLATQRQESLRYMERRLGFQSPGERIALGIIADGLLQGAYLEHRELLVSGETEEPWSRAVALRIAKARYDNWFISAKDVLEAAMHIPQLVDYTDILHPEGFIKRDWHQALTCSWLGVAAVMEKYSICTNTRGWLQSLFALTGSEPSTPNRLITHNAILMALRKYPELDDLVFLDVDPEYNYLLANAKHSAYIVNFVKRVYADLQGIGLDMDAAQPNEAWNLGESLVAALRPIVIIHVVTNRTPVAQILNDVALEGLSLAAILRMYNNKDNSLSRYETRFLEYFADQMTLGKLLKSLWSDKRWGVEKIAEITDMTRTEVLLHLVELELIQVPADWFSPAASLNIQVTEGLAMPLEMQKKVGLTMPATQVLYAIGSQPLALYNEGTMQIMADEMQRRYQVDRDEVLKLLRQIR